MIWIATPRFRIKNEKSLCRNFTESIDQIHGVQTVVCIVP
jgi:hypothetical protein